MLTCGHCRQMQAAHRDPQARCPVHHGDVVDEKPRKAKPKAKAKPQRAARRKG